MGAPAIKYNKYTYADYSTWDDSERWELIGGYPYNMSPAPNRFHQEVAGKLYNRFSNYLEGKYCKVYIAPFDVRLAEKGETAAASSNVVQPDITVICDKNKLDDKGAFGAPDLIVEVLSPSTLKKDTQEKFILYERFGVKEYWIVDPDQKTVAVYILNSNQKYTLSKKYSSAEKLPVTIFTGFEIDLNGVFAD